MVQSMTWSPSSITNHWVGRTNSSLRAPQRMRLGIGRSFRESSTMVGNRLAVGLPLMTWLKRSFGPLWSISLSSTPHFLAKPSAAWVGLPSASKAAWRAVEVDAAVRLLGFQRGQQHRQTARRGIDLFRLKLQAGALQAFFDTGQERIGQGVQRLGWQLFGAQFNQKILSTHCAASSLANTSSRRSGVAIGKPSLARASR